MSNINLFPELDNEQVETDEYVSIRNEVRREDELIVFGYSCKLFRDDFSAKAIDRGQSLIPWNGDENVMIDRYDCRGHLSDLTLWDSDLIRKKSNVEQDHFLTDQEKQIEEECEQERYLELYRDIENEALQQEEELKRTNADKNTYKQVGFSYDDTKESSTKTTDETPQPLDDDEYEPFYPSEKLQIPYGMDIPESIKLNAVIEKTASFVSTSGVQMEIVLKTKQANNPQFDFLKYDHYLNPYYRHLIIMIKSGKYRPNVDNNTNSNNKQTKNSTKNGVDQNSSHDEDESGDSYLHPLLRGRANNDNNTNNSKKKSDETSRIPSVQMNIHNTAYGQLIKKYEHLRQRDKVVKEVDEDKMSTKSEEIKNEESSPRSECSSSTGIVIPPPPDVKPIIDKLAEYVARDGPAFEQSIRTKNDPRFGFLERDHIHHNYYQLKVQLCTQENLRNKTDDNQRTNDSDEQRIHGKGFKLVLKTNPEESLTPTLCQEFRSDDDDDDDSRSASQNGQDDNGEFIGPRPPSPEFLEKMRKQEQRRERVNDFVREKITRDKQEERKRKAELLVQKLKSTSNELSSTSHTSNSTVNPILVEKLLNVKTERPTSSLITSPQQYHHHHSKHSQSPSKSRSRSKYHRRSRSRSKHRRQRRSSHKRSRTRSKSRSRHRSKRSKNSKSSRYSRSHQHRRHRRRHSSSSRNSSSTSRSASASSSSSSSSSSSTSSSHEKKRKKKTTTTHNTDDSKRKNPQSSKWDQREPIKALSTENVSTISSLLEPTLSNSTT